MTRWRLVLQTLRCYWRAQVAVGLAAAVGTAVLVGALAVGDSMQASLRQAMAYRLGSTQFAMVAPERYFSEALAARLEEFLSTPTAPLLYARGLVRSGDGSKRVNQVHVYGVDDRFYALCPGVDPLDGATEGMALNKVLADRLEAEPGDSLLLRLEKPEHLSRDIVLVPDSDRSVGSRQVVRAIAGPEQFGRFSLEANQAIPYNVFVPLAWLQGLIDRTGMANTLLVGQGAEPVTEEEANAAVRRCWSLEDAQLELVTLTRQSQLELSTPRVFIDEAVSESMQNAEGVLTYFVNDLRHGDRSTPYSMVSALPPDSRLGALPTDIRDDQIVISQWLADDLQAGVGDEVTLKYYVLAEKRDLIEAEKAFEICRVLPMTHPAIDPNLMPDFPGLSGADNCRDWEPGVDIDLKKIRDTDEVYWDDYGGSPKAFMSLEAGQAIWGSRYGKLTALRFDATQITPEALTQQVLQRTQPAALGFFFRPVQALSEAALTQGTSVYFGYLFLALSMFLIVGAVILTGLLFGFSLESRREQTGLFLALGLSPKLVRLLFVQEGLVVAMLGTVPGVFAGLLYARVLIMGLAEFWQGAIAHTAIEFAVTPGTCAGGAVGGIVAAFLAMLVTMRRQLKYEPRALLAGDAVRPVKAGAGRQPVSLVVGLVAFVGIGALLLVPAEDSQAESGLFFGVGFGVLVLALAICSQVMGRLAWRWDRPMVALAGLAARNVSRRRGRSLAAVGLLAIGVFLVVSIRAFYLDPEATDTSRSSGTGGFQWVGQAGSGILHDLDTERGRANLNLDSAVLGATKWVPMRVYDGDDASCLNLNRAQNPRLLGVDPNRLAERGAFSFVKTAEKTKENPWELLNKDFGNYVVPVIGDFPTVKYGLGKDVGSLLEYRDEAGNTFSTRIVGTIEGSVLQGNLIMAERHFVRLFPAQAGYRFMLLETPEGDATAIADHLSERLQDSGLVLTDARARLAMFNEIQNTYLTMFSALGGLGLLLGTVGLGLVVMRTMLDRKSETAMLLAVGLSKNQLKRMLALEHWGILAAGLLSGCLAALIAIWPAIRSSSHIPYASLTLWVAGIGLSGVIWVWFATLVALQGPLLEGLRRE